MTYFDKIRGHRKGFVFISLLLLVVGGALYVSMPVSLFPDITFPRIVIHADNGEEPAERMLIEVTKPIEETVSSIPGVKSIRSVTSRGSSEINIYLDWGTNVLQTLELIRGQIATVRNTIPQSATIDAQQMNVSIFPIEGYSLTSNTLSLVELRDVALYQVRPQLLQIPGISRVEILGGDTREFEVTVSPQQLARYHLDIRQVSDAVNKANIIGSTGLVDNNYQLYLSLVQGTIKNTSDISEVTVAVQNGVPIHVGDLGVVTPSVQDQFIRITAHGKTAVLINVIKQPSASTVDIGDQVKEKLAHFKFAGGIRIENFYDQSGYISDSIASTRDSILIGIVLAMIVLFLFLKSWRITLVLVIIVPTTIAATLICLNVIGETVNIMTLGGIAAAVGLIIDDSIVVIESIFTHFTLENARGMHGPFLFIRSANSSIREILPAVVSSTLSTIVIHIPLGFLSGIAGAFFKPLSITMVFALIISFVLSLTLAPLLASIFIRSRDIEREVAKEHKPSRMNHAYEQIMRALFRVKWIVLPVGAGIMILTYVIYSQVGSGFMPEMDEGAFVIDYSSPPGTSLNETNRMLVGVEDMLMRIPEVESYSRRTGAQQGGFLTEPNAGDYTVKLKSARTRTITDIIGEVRKKIESTEPRLRIDFGQLLQDVIGDLTNSPSPIEIKLFGTNMRLLQQKADEIKTAIESVPGVVDAFNGVVISGPSLLIRVDPYKASIYGMNATDIQGQLETIMRGKVESTIPTANKVIGIRVRYPEPFRSNMDSISSMLISSPTGVLVPLSNVATISHTVGQAELHREGLRPYVAVTARLETVDLGTAIAQIKAKLSKSVFIPKGVQLEYGGVYQTQQESFHNLMIVALIAFLLVFLVLLIEFKEFSAPLAIILITIFSLVGVLLALLVTGVTLNISSFVGLIMIIGIVAENAVFIIHYVKLPSHQSQGLDSALIEAIRERLRPIAMTTLAAVLALLPLALGLGAGAQMQQPLAIAVIGGFSVSTIMLFFLLPLLYSLLHGKHETPMEHLEERNEEQRIKDIENSKRTEE